MKKARTLDLLTIWLAIPLAVSGLAQDSSTPAAAGLPHRASGTEPKEDGRTFPPPHFNLVSALHHACGAVAFVHETPCGLRTRPYPQVDHDQLLDLQLLLYDELFRHAVSNPLNWLPAKRPTAP